MIGLGGTKLTSRGAPLGAGGGLMQLLKID